MMHLKGLYSVNNKTPNYAFSQRQLNQGIDHL